MLKGFCTVVLILVSLLPPLAVQGQETIGVSAPKDLLPEGAQVPSFTLPDIDGALFDPSQILGKSAIVISFWSIYCDSCVDEMLSLQKLEDKYRGEGLTIIAINEDINVPRERIRRFIERLEKFRGKITYPLLYDEGSEVLNAFGATTLPTLVLVDKAGRVSGYARGFDPEGERELLAGIESLASGTSGQPAPQTPLPRTEVFPVRGEAALCGFFDSSGWRKSFSGSENLDEELILTRDLARRSATREAVTGALRMLGIKLYSNPGRDGCLDEKGIHLGRDPFDTGDPISNFLELLSYSKYFETLEDQEMLIDNTYYVSRKVRVYIDSLSGELQALGYVFEPIKITFTFVNMTPLDQMDFLASLLKNSRYVGRFDRPVFSAASTYQVFEVYTSSQNFADEILGMDFGDLQVFVEQVTTESLELEVWK